MNNDQITKMVWVACAISKEFSIEPGCIGISEFVIVFDIGDTVDCIRYYVENNHIWCTGDYDVIDTRQRRILAGIAYEHGLELIDE